MGSKGDALRQRIVAAADELFYKKGYENTSFRDISDEVNISRGNFYYHFKSKDEILNAVIDARISAFESMLKAWDKKIIDPKKRLYYFIDMLSRNEDEITSYGCPVGGLCTELAKTSHAMQGDANRMFIVFCDWIVTQLKLLGIKNNTKQVALHLLVLAQGAVTISNAFEDKRFLQQEVKRAKQWLDAEIPKYSRDE